MNNETPYELKKDEVLVILDQETNTVEVYDTITQELWEEVNNNDLLGNWAIIKLNEDGELPIWRNHSRTNQKYVVI